MDSPHTTSADPSSLEPGRPPGRRRARVLTVLLVVVLAGSGIAIVGRLSGATWPPISLAEPIRIGAVFPLEGNAGGLAAEQLLGVQIAAEFVNQDGGVDGRRIVLEVRNLASRQDAPGIMRALQAEGVRAVIGAYSSDLSIAASAAASDAGLVYWEAGAVADQLTGRGLPMVFRVGASGANLGRNSANFAATQIAPMLGTTASRLRVAIVAADDEYARSVADAVAAAGAGIRIVSRTTYNLLVPDWPRVMTEVAASRPEVVILASHIPDGIAFRRAMLAANLKVGALIGTTMAQCSPDFARDLGADAIGVFASDRPTGGFQPSALGREARATYDRFAAAWARRHPARGSANHEYEGGQAHEEAEYGISGPVEAGSTLAGPSEEGLSGFSAAWVLFRHVLPAAAGRGTPDPAEIAAEAWNLDLPEGALPNGGGVRFSRAVETLGQNERAAAVMWQWQAVRSYTFVWPPAYKTGEVAFVPLPR